MCSLASESVRCHISSDIGRRLSSRIWPASPIARAMTQAPRPRSAFVRLLALRIIPRQFHSNAKCLRMGFHGKGHVEVLFCLGSPDLSRAANATSNPPHLRMRRFEPRLLPDCAILGRRYERDEGVCRILLLTSGRCRSAIDRVQSDGPW
jgi:hypothetical protein